LVHLSTGAGAKEKATSALRSLLHSENVESWLAWQVGLRKVDEIDHLLSQANVVGKWKFRPSAGVRNRAHRSIPTSAESFDF
jgi:hypothetical protein